MTPVIDAWKISVRIGASILLDDVTLGAAPGETIALVGPNGAGKSTLMRVLSGELRPQSGQIRLKGRDVRAYSPRDLARHRAVLSQSNVVTFPFTVAEIVGMGAGDRTGAAVEKLVDAALAEVDLADFRERVITTLSGGEQARAHFARILVQLACGEESDGPGLLLLDEPTASLDLRHQIDLAAAVGRCAARGVAVVAILHDLNLATLFAKRIVVLDRGRVAGDGPPEQIVTDAMLDRVFGVSEAVGNVPRDVPFVLPHQARRTAR